MLIFRDGDPASAENIFCHWVCEIIRVIHDPVARNVLLRSLRVVRLEKSTWEEGSRTRKNKKFSSKNFSGFFRIHGKISKENLPLALQPWDVDFFETAPFSEAENISATGSVKLSGYSRPSGKKCALSSPASRASRKINMRGEGSRTRKNKKFSSKNFFRIFPYSRKNFERKLTP